MDEGDKTKIYQSAIKEGAKATFEQGAKYLGGRHVAQVTARETAKYVATVTSQQGAEAGAAVVAAKAAAQYTSKVAASQAAAATWAKVAGPAAGVVVAPIAECITLARDGQEHEAADYTEAGMRGFASGAAAAAAGAAVGSVVPVAGTAVGAVVGVAVSLGVNSWLKENAFLESAAQETVEIAEGIADLAGDTLEVMEAAVETVFEATEEVLSGAWKGLRRLTFGAFW